MKRYFVFFAVAFAVVLLIVNAFNFTPKLCLLLGIISAVTSMIFALTKHIKQAIAIFLGFAFAVSWFYIYLNFSSVPELDDTKIKFTAIAKDFSYENNKKTGVVCDLKILSEDDKFVARIYFNDKNLKIHPGDIVNGECKFQHPVNDRDFNTFTYYKARGIDAIGFCNESVAIEKSEGFNIKYLPQYISNAVSERVKELLPKREAGLVNAILLGDKTDFTLEDQSNFSSIGLAHVVAVSGMHLAFLAGFIVLIFGRRISTVFAVPILLLFTLVVGAPPSVLRALIMQLMLMAAPAIRREADSITSLSLAMFLILLFNPYVVLDIGFQLSFLATLGLILYSGKLNYFFTTHIKTKNKFINKIIFFFSSTLSSTLSAILFTTPVIIWNFKSISLVAPVSNLLLIWAVTAVFFGSIAGILISFVSFGIGRVIMYPVWLLSSFLIFSAKLIAKSPFAEIFVDNIFAVIFIIYCYFIIFFFIKAEKKTFLIPVICITVVLTATYGLKNISEKTSSYGGIRFSVLDVGQGASLVADYNDDCIVVDCGGSRSVNAGDITGKYIKRSKTKNIDRLILTHMHLDHINGAKRLIEQNEVLNLYVPLEAKEDEAFKNIAESAIRRGTKIFYVSEETRLKSYDAECIIYPSSSSDNENEKGLAIVFKKDDFELIVTGDLGQNSEELLCENYELFDTEVYIVGHHGSDTSSSLKFMNRILPEFAVISVGADNYYGHPSKATLDLFNNMGIFVRRTDIDGNIIFYSDEFIKGGN